MSDNIKNLIDRVAIFIEEGDFQKANEYCEKILDIDATNAETYLYKLLIEYKCKSLDDLIKIEVDFSSSSNYSKMIKFGDDNLINRIKDTEQIIKNNKKNKLETELTDCLNSKDISLIEKKIKLYENIDIQINTELLDNSKKHLANLKVTNKRKRNRIILGLIIATFIICGSIFVYKSFIACKHLETYTTDLYLRTTDDGDHVCIDTKCLKCDKVLKIEKIKSADYFLNVHSRENDVAVRFTRLHFSDFMDEVNLYYDIKYLAEIDLHNVYDVFELEIYTDGKIDRTSYNNNILYYSLSNISHRMCNDDYIVSKEDTYGAYDIILTLNCGAKEFVLGNQNHTIKYVCNIFDVNTFTGLKNFNPNYGKLIDTSTHSFNLNDFTNVKYELETIYEEGKR